MSKNPLQKLEKLIITCDTISHRKNKIFWIKDIRENSKNETKEGRPKGRERNESNQEQGFKKGVSNCTKNYEEMKLLHTC